MNYVPYTCFIRKADAAKRGADLGGVDVLENGRKVHGLEIGVAYTVCYNVLFRGNKLQMKLSSANQLIISMCHIF